MIEEILSSLDCEQMAREQRNMNANTRVAVLLFSGRVADFPFLSLSLSHISPETSRTSMANS